MPRLAMPPEHVREFRLSLPQNLATTGGFAALFGVNPSTLWRWEHVDGDGAPAYVAAFAAAIDSIASTRGDSAVNDALSAAFIAATTGRFPTS